MIATAFLLGLGVILLDPAVQNHQRYLQALVTALPFIIAVYLVCNLAMGAYRRDLAQSGPLAVKRVALASAIAIPIMITLAATARAIAVVLPYSALLLGGIGAIVAMGLVRFLSRSLSVTTGNQAGQ